MKNYIIDEIIIICKAIQQFSHHLAKGCPQVHKAKRHFLEAEKQAFWCHNTVNTLLVDLMFTCQYPLDKSILGQIFLLVDLRTLLL